MSLLPGAVEGGLAVAELEETAGYSGTVIILGVVAVPSVIIKACQAIEIEEHSPAVLVLEDRLGGSGRSRHLDLAGLGAFGHHHGD